MSQQTASPALSKLGNEIVARMAHEVVTGASLVLLQLLASQFYEAMKADIEQTPHEPARIGALTSAADRCRRSAENCLSPHLMLVEIRAAVAMLSAPPVAYQTDTVVRFRPPQLRVIQGGLA
jgi:hypothetical protein